MFTDMLSAALILRRQVRRMDVIVLICDRLYQSAWLIMIIIITSNDY